MIPFERNGEMFRLSLSPRRFVPDSARYPRNARLGRLAAMVSATRSSLPLASP